MKRLLMIATLMVFLVVGVASAQPTLQLVWSQQCDGETRVRSNVVECWEEIGLPPTPTAEPGATPTPEPTPTATPEPGIPMCFHDPLVWHDIYDEAQGCRYDHEHGDDPHTVDGIFGAPGAWFGSPGWEIGSPAVPEHELHGGHNFWKTYVRRGLTAADNEVVGADGSYIAAVRCQSHVATGGNGIKHRYHGVVCEIQACRPVADGGKGEAPLTETCGTFQSTGTMDYGNLHIPDRTTGGTLPFLLPNQGDGQDVIIEDARRIHSDDPLTPYGTEAIWYPRGWSGPAGSVNLQLNVRDGWAYVEPTDAGDDVAIVPFGTGTGTQRQLHVVSVHVQDWQPHDGTWLTDTYGDPDPACVTLGQTGCGLQVLTNWPGDDQLVYTERSTWTFYAPSPAEQAWIAFPN